MSQDQDQDQEQSGSAGAGTGTTRGTGGGAGTGTNPGTGAGGGRGTTAGVGATAGAGATARTGADGGTDTPAGTGAGAGTDESGKTPKRGRWRRFWHALTRPWRWVALLAGALPVLAFPSPNVEFLAWFGLVPGILIARAAPSGREAAVRGWWMGTGFLVTAMYWLLPNLGPALVLVTIVLGAPWIGFGYAAWRLLRGRDGSAPALWQCLAAIFVLPSCWVVVDWIRSWQGIGGPWGVFGATQWQHPVVLSLAAVGGIWLITFVLVAANAGIAVLLTAASWTGRAAGAVATLLAIGAGPAAFALTAGEYAVPPTGRLTLALVQPGIQPTPLTRLNAGIRLTLAARPADMVVWGESSVGYDLRTDHKITRRLQQLSARIGSPVLVSQDAVSPAGAKSKVADLIGPGGIEQSYTKTRLVPFGEYIPFRSVLGWLTSISKAAPQNMVTGTGARVLHTTIRSGRQLKFGVLICFESAFPDMSRVDAIRGAQVIIYQTSDSTFQASWAPQQHASLAALRAAETGRPAVQAALTGDSAAFDARGRLLAWAGTADRGVLHVTVNLPPASVRTPFDRYGEYVPWFAIAVTVIALLIRLNTARMNRRRTG